jgi:hypothetical protein
MQAKRHGLFIGIERHETNHFFLSLKAVGTLTHDDYQKITPLIDSALEGITDPSINALIDGTELDGWEPRAAWDDFKIGLKHGSQFNKIAIHGNKRWQEMAAKIGSWFISGEVRFFDNEQDAFSWLTEH